MKSIVLVLAKIAAFVFIVFIFWTINVTVHEVGHLVLAKYFGLQVQEVVVNNGTIIWEPTVVTTKFRFGLNVFGGGLTKINDLGSMPLDWEMAALYLAPTPLITLLLTIVFMAIRRGTREAITISPSMAGLVKRIKSPTLRLYYSSFLTITGFMLILPGLAIWNAFVDKRKTYKLLLVRISKAQKLSFTNFCLVSCLINGLIVQTLNIWPFCWNDFLLIPVRFIFNYYVVEDWVMTALSLLIHGGFLWTIISACAILKRRAKGEFEEHMNNCYHNVKIIY